MSDAFQEKNLSKENQNQNSPLIETTKENIIPKSFQSEGVSSTQNSVDYTKDLLSNISKSKKENNSQQKTLNNFFQKNSTNKNKNPIIIKE